MQREAVQSMPKHVNLNILSVRRHNLGIQTVEANRL